MSKKTKMLASEIRSLIAPALHEALPEVGVVSLTEVEVTPDGNHATLFISALEDPQAALKYLEAKLPSLQHSLRALERQKIPELRLKLDERGERGARIDELLS